MCPRQYIHHTVLSLPPPLLTHEPATDGGAEHEHDRARTLKATTAHTAHKCRAEQRGSIQAAEEGGWTSEEGGRMSSKARLDFMGVWVTEEEVLEQPGEDIVGQDLLAMELRQ